MIVSFTLNNPKRKISSIRASVTIGGKKYRFNTGESVQTNCFVKGRCKSGVEKDIINNKLELIESAIKSTLVYFKQEYKIPTQDVFTKKVLQFLSGQNIIDIKKNDGLFLNYVSEYIQACDKSQETVKGYTTTLNMLKKYEEEKHIKLTFDDISLRFANDLKKWMHEQGYSRNYIGTHFKQIKKWMHDAQDVDKMHTNQDYKQFKVEAETADTVYLSIEELLKIHHLVIDEASVNSLIKDNRSHNIKIKIESLDLVRKKFLIGAFTALRVSDFNRIQEYNIQDEYIRILPKKGSSIRKPQPVVIPMHYVIKEILDSGFNINTSISEQKINKHIKEVCRIAGICQQVVTYRTEGGVLNEYVNEKCDVITTHTARRSGATNMYKAGINKKSIMLLTGHSTEAQFEKYIKLSAEENAEGLRDHDYFKLGWSVDDLKKITNLIDRFRKGIL